MATEISVGVARQRLHAVEELRESVRQILKCVINLHIEILMLESNVTQLIDEVKTFNADLHETQRLDMLIRTLRNYNGPPICHEWPFPHVSPSNIDEADLAIFLNQNPSNNEHIPIHPIP